LAGCEVSSVEVEDAARFLGDSEAIVGIACKVFSDLLLGMDGWSNRPAIRNMLIAMLPEMGTFRESWRDSITSSSGDAVGRVKVQL
jgi:hypothetical protein